MSNYQKQNGGGEMKPIPNISYKTIQKLVEKHKDPTFGTYDYDGIAVEVIKLVSGLNKK